MVHMNKILAFSFLLILAATAMSQDSDDWVTPKSCDYPSIARSGSTIGDFVPKGFKIVKSATGDLNGDKRPDAVLGLIGTSAKFINKNENLGSDEFDTNPRILAVLFRNPDKSYSLKEQSNTFIISPYSPVSDEPFEDLTIEDGVIKIDFLLWQSAGGWGTTRASYKFRYAGNEFQLIGADRMDLQRNTGETEHRSYNFLTRRVKVSKGNTEMEKPETVTWETLKPGKLKTLNTFPVPFEWEVTKDQYL